MTKNPTRSEIEASLPPELGAPFNQLFEDYNAAAKIHVPTYRGKVNAGIIAELIRRGWRRLPPKQGTA